MKDKCDVYEIFIATLQEKVPAKKTLVNLLSSMLVLDKEAIYRRLRGIVPFTFADIMTVSKELNISLDSITGATSVRSFPFEMRMFDCIFMENNYEPLQNYLEYLKSLLPSPISEASFASSFLPLHFLMTYHQIHRLLVLKWSYQFNSLQKLKSFSETILSERHILLCRKIRAIFYNVEYTCFIWNELTILYLINDIKYFYSIRIINMEEVNLIKQDLLLFIADLEKMANTGMFHTGKRVDIYVSNLNFETSYSYFISGNTKLTFVRSTTFDDAFSSNHDVFNFIYSWIHSLKRTSVLISVCNTMQRIEFFDEQRKLVEENLMIS
ncbi:MAG: hypothetical protein LBD45_09745 [Bacteroidales bacterium]|jgi:hypothetical protein|nr:hypothetical protein [Bacteroidales bacterium]